MVYATIDTYITDCISTPRSTLTRHSLTSVQLVTLTHHRVVTPAALLPVVKYSVTPSGSLKHPLERYLRSNGFHCLRSKEVLFRFRTDNAFEVKNHQIETLQQSLPLRDEATAMTQKEGPVLFPELFHFLRAHTSRFTSSLYLPPPYASNTGCTVRLLAFYCRYADMLSVSNLILSILRIRGNVNKKLASSISSRLTRPLIEL